MYSGPEPVRTARFITFPLTPLARQTFTWSQAGEPAQIDTLTHFTSHKLERAGQLENTGFLGGGGAPNTKYINRM